MSDYLSCYGHPPTSRFELNYETWVSLQLNVSRVRMQRAMAVAQGEQIANTHGPLSYEWAEAISSDEAEAEEALFRLNKARAQSRMHRR